MCGWIKIYRSLLNWEWFQKPEMVQLFVYLLLKASVEDRKWQGIAVSRGQLVTSIATICRDLSLSTKKVRNCLEHLKNTQAISIKTTNKFSVITICNYATYQTYEMPEGQTKGKQRANKGQTKGKQRATSKEDKNKKNNKNNNKSSKDDLLFGEQTTQKKEFDYHEFVDFFNSEMTNQNSIIPKIRSLGGNRKNHINARLREYGVDALKCVVQKMAESNFLNGRNNRGWVADFSWAILPNNFQKILEGKYDNYGTEENMRDNAKQQRDAEFAEHIAKKLTGNSVF